MGKNITLLVLLLLMLGGAVWQSVFIHDATNTLTDDLEKVSLALENNDLEKAAQAAHDFDKAWQRQKFTYEALFEHKEVDSISASAKMLSSLCAPDFIPEAQAATHEIMFYLEHIKDIDCVGWENIF